jgi:PAS domain S-box-containing protein
LIVESCAEAIIHASTDGTVLTFNAAAASMFDCRQSDAIGRPLSSFRPPSQWAKQRDAFALVLAGQSLVLEMVALRRGGVEFPTSISLWPVKAADGTVLGVAAILRDLSVSARASDDQALESADLPPALSRVHSTGDASVVIVGNRIVFASTMAVDMVGAVDATELVGRDVFDFVAPTSTEASLARQESARRGRWPRPEMITIRRIDGSERQVELASTPVLWEDGQPASQMTMWEPLDGAERLRQIATGVRTDVADAIIIFDTNFHVQSLNGAAEELYGWTEAEASGKSMNEIMPWLGSEADLNASKFILRSEGRWHGRAIQGRRDGEAVHVLAATTLLTDDLGQPSGAISVNRRISEASITPAEPPATPPLYEELRRGLDHDEFIVYYQPIVRLGDGTPIGVEALVRWNHPTRGLLAPDQFIDAAERSGLICELGEVVLMQACLQAQRWRGAGLNLYLSVNVSARQLADGSLPARFAKTMSLTGMRPSDMWIEITETTLVEDLDQARTGLREIDALGVRVSIDDFGTGWASLTYLREFPVHALKIDYVFVRGLATSSCDLAIVKSILGLGRELGLDVVAEGIETLDQRALLYQLGCDKGQGYFFGGPAPAGELFPARSN